MNPFLDMLYLCKRIIERIFQRAIFWYPALVGDNSDCRLLTSQLGDANNKEQIPNIPEEQKGQWITITKTKKYQRKTFIKGKLLAKFYADLDETKEALGFVRERYFDFTLYDAEIKDALFRRNNEGPFEEFAQDELFRGKMQPQILPCRIAYQNVQGNFQIQLLDLKLANVDFNKHRILQQEETKEVFGTVEADITGYLREEFTSQEEQQIWVENPTPVPNDSKLNELSIEPAIETGNTRSKGKYQWSEFRNKMGSNRFWAQPQFQGKYESGCLNTFMFLFWGLLVLGLLSVVGAQGLGLALVILALMLLLAYFSQILLWLLGIIAAAVVFVGLFALLSAIKTQTEKPRLSFAEDDPTEKSETRKDNQSKQDSLIIHHRIWKDYNGQQYEGNIWVRRSDFHQSSQYKNNLHINTTNKQAYDAMLASLMVQDASKLQGVYHALDSIKKVNALDTLAFAQVIVSFIQDIPYTLVLENACLAELYEDEFTKNYLQLNQLPCSGYQRFGINAPVEFMATLQGDCDSRTLLLYTMLSHYGYHIAILSSELYAHSILAIQLPFPGKSIIIHEKPYVLWETTTPGSRPGQIPEDISNVRNWRISLIQ